MSAPTKQTASSEAMDVLSRLVLSPALDEAHEAAQLRSMSEEQFETFVSMAHSNHVVIRGMEVYRRLMLNAGDLERAERAAEILAEEHARIAVATDNLQKLAQAFRQANLDLTVIKTLDHWPDFGSDIDLYTNAEPNRVAAFMQQSFQATISARSWGDRLAGKWNFEIPGLPEAVEIHMCRLGQTGEQLTLAKNIPARSRVLSFGDKTFQVAAASDRILISTLQRMYRHFYFRLCDIVDSASLVQSGSLNFDDLRQWAEACGIWPGAATYLVLVSDYVQRYSGSPLALPDFVRKAARFDGKAMYCGGMFLRVPILPQSAGLYGTQLLGLVKTGQFQSSARLGLLPWLASAAAVGYKMTGSDKGIW